MCYNLLVNEGLSRSDGLTAEFEQRQRSRYGRYEDGELKATVLSPELKVLYYDVSGMARYYVKQGENFVAHVSMDHESGVHLARWTIDPGEGPLLTAEYRVQDRRERQIKLGFQSRGVPGSQPDELHFPQFLAKYKFLGEQLQFDGSARPKRAGSERNLTTGEDSELAVVQDADSVVLRTATASGANEAIILPSSIDFSWMSRIDETTAVFDESMPYMGWKDELEASYSSSSV